MTSRKFQVLFTADFFEPDGRPKFANYGTAQLAEVPGIEVDRFAEHRREIGSDQIAGAQGLIVLSPRVTALTLTGSDNLLAVARFGVGFDNVDVAACTKADVAATITRGAVDRSMAEATVGWMIALSHHMMIKDRLLREGSWDERTRYMGTELRDRTLGVIGFGGIGSRIVQRLTGFEMKQPLAYDPYLDEEAIAAKGARQVDLSRLLREADFVSVNCPLTDETRNLLGAPQLALMKPSAYLINTARGGIIDEDALFDALKKRLIAGAALDCFAGEPITSPHRFGTLENVLLAPHSIAWTGEMFRDIGNMACQSMIDLAQGRPPHGILNPEVLEKPTFQEKWKRLQLG